MRPCSRQPSSSHTLPSPSATQAGGQQYSPQQIASFVLTKMKETAGGSGAVCACSCLGGRMSHMHQRCCAPAQRVKETAGGRPRRHQGLACPRWHACRGARPQLHSARVGPPSAAPMRARLACIWSQAGAPALGLSPGPQALNAHQPVLADLLDALALANPSPAPQCLDALVHAETYLGHSVNKAVITVPGGCWTCACLEGWVSAAKSCIMCCMCSVCIGAVLALAGRLQVVEAVKDAGLQRGLRAEA